MREHGTLPLPLTPTLTLTLTLTPTPHQVGRHARARHLQPEQQDERAVQSDQVGPNPHPNPSSLALALALASVPYNPVRQEAEEP